MGERFSGGSSSGGSGSGRQGPGGLEGMAGVGGCLGRAGQALALIAAVVFIILLLAAILGRKQPAPAENAPHGSQPTSVDSQPGDNPRGSYCRVTVSNASGRTAEIRYAHAQGDNGRYLTTLSAGAHGTFSIPTGQGSLCLIANLFSGGGQRTQWFSVERNGSYGWNIESIESK